jgi:hypothetical protein
MKPNKQISTPTFSRRSICVTGFGLFLISACEAKPMTVTLDVVLFSYLDRSIFDVTVGKNAIGIAGAFPFSGRGTMMGMKFDLGPQKVTWTLDGPEGMARNGEVVTSKNQPELKDVPRQMRYLAVHIYPDNTVELVLTEHFPGLSQRGEDFKVERERKNGK